MPDTRIIKKYPNRRLYDTTLGAYITLADIKKLVLTHVDFQIIDAHTQKDITQNTLMQIISEQEMTSTPIFTTALLQYFIRFYHEKSQHVLGQFLEQAITVFIKQKDFFQTQWGAYQQFLANPLFQKNNIQKKSKQPNSRKHAHYNKRTRKKTEK